MLYTFSQNLQVEERSVYPKVNPITSQTTDFEFVLSCCHPKPQLCPRDQVRSQITNGIDWRTVANIAVYHGVTPLFFHNLKTLAEEMLPREMGVRIGQYFQVTMSHNRIQMFELGRVIETLGQHQIPAIVLKGRPLGQEAYNDISLRRATDFDVLIPEEKFAKAESCLLADGYQPFQKVKNLTGLKKRLGLWFSKQYPLKKYDGLFNLDLHIGVMPPGYHYPVTFGQLLKRSKSISINGVEMRALEPEELLILLVYHGVKNQWHSLKYVCDIAALLESHPDFNWETVLSRTKEDRSRRFLLVGLSLAKKLLNVSLPDQLERQIKNNVIVEKVVSTLVDILRLRHLGRAFSYRERVWFHLVTREDYRDKFRYVFSSLLANIWVLIFKRNPVEN